MSMELTRRDFLKCAGVTVLAVGTGSLLTGCGGSSSSNYGTAGIGSPLTFADITVTLNEWSQKDVKAGAAGVELEYKNAKFLLPEVTLRNGSGKSIYLDNNKNFRLFADGTEMAGWTKSLSEVVAGSTNLLGGSTGIYEVKDGEEITGVVAFTVKTGWQKAELRFAPDTNKPNEYIRFIFTSTKNETV